ncbi:MAG: recombinase [Stackebrandtia sp.]
MGRVIGRLNEIDIDLHTRRKRAEEEGRLGEVDGIDPTSTFLADKRAEAKRISVFSPVNVGLPIMRDGGRQ